MEYNCLISGLLDDNSMDIGGKELDMLKEKLSSNTVVERLPHPEVRYEVTNKCNATCIMCPRDKQSRAQGIMDQDKYERSVDEVHLLGAERVVLTGFGEPLLDKRLEDKVSYLSNKGMSSYFITNASGLTKSRSEKLLDAGLDELRISFYGMNDKSYNAVMQGLDFDRTKQKIIDFLELKNKHSHATTVQVSFLEMNENKDDTEDFIKLWENMVDAVEVWKPHNFGDGRDYRKRVDKDNLLIKKTCGRPKNGPLQIQWNGEVVPCCYDYNNAIILGNAFQQDVLEILNGFKYRLLRYAHKTGRFNMFPFCSQCDQLLPHADALVYTNRHDLPAEEAVKLSNTDLHNLSVGTVVDDSLLSEKYRNK